MQQLLEQEEELAFDYVQQILESVRRTRRLVVIEETVADFGTSNRRARNTERAKELQQILGNVTVGRNCWIGRTPRRPARLADHGRLRRYRRWRPRIYAQHDRASPDRPPRPAVP